MPDQTPLRSESLQRAAPDGDGVVGLEVVWPEGQPKGWMLWVPGYGTGPNWGCHPWLRRWFASAGWVVGTVALSGTAVGDDGVTTADRARFGRNTYLRELQDLAVAREMMVGRPGAAGLPAVVCGHSRGGGMAIVHAAEVQAAGHPYHRVVAWAAIDSILRFSPERLALWREQGSLVVRHPILREGVRLDVAVLEAAVAHRERLDILAACGRLDGPVLAVHAGGDKAVPEEALRNIAAAAGRGHFVEVSGADHVFGARHPFPPAGGVPAHLVAAARVTAAWLDDLGVGVTPSAPPGG